MKSIKIVLFYGIMVLYGIVLEGVWQQNKKIHKISYDIWEKNA